MRFKKLTKSQIIISIDRLTRFKPAEEKYLRVFKDIIISNLIEPKIKKNELEKMEYEKIRDIAVHIFNSSLEEDNTNDLTINFKLKEYENDIFYNSIDTNKLLDNKLDYKSAIKLLNTPDEVNLKWLIKIDSQDIYKMREKYALQYPISKVIIVEGITEEILLPEFSNKLGYNFLQNGIKIIPAGGKNQVVKLYYSLSQELKLPIFILLDKDAVDNKVAIQKKLRNTDKVYILNSGEFEDLLPLDLIIDTLNSHFKNFATVNFEDFISKESMVTILENIFKEKGLHEFKKAEFAHLIKLQINSHNDISDEIRQIIEEIKNLPTLNRQSV